MTEVKVIKTPVACGTCVTTQHFKDGNLVRQDIEIQVDPKLVPGLEGIAGDTNGYNPSNL